VRAGEKSAEAVVAKKPVTPVEPRAEGRKDRTREATGTGDREGSEVRGRDNYGRHPAERKGQKRWNCGEPGAANPRERFCETSDTEPCTSI